MGLILDSSALIADEREGFNLAGWLRSRPPEPVAISVITFSELWFGLELRKTPVVRDGVVAGWKRVFDAWKSYRWMLLLRASIHGRGLR